MGTIINITTVIIVLSILFNYLLKLLRRSQFLNRLFHILLFIMHYSSFILYYNFSNNLKKDSFGFYHNSFDIISVLDSGFLGSQFMSFLVYPFSSIGLSFFTTSFLFSTISYYAFSKYASFLTEETNYRKSWQFIIPLLLFLTPSLHFWTSGLTKEAIVFSLMCIVFFEINQFHFYSKKLIICFLLILFIRPYLFLILILSVSLFFIMNKKSYKNIYFIITFFALTFIGFLFISLFLDLEKLDINSLNNVLEKITVYSITEGNSSIIIKDSSYVGRLFLVLFRPFFYDAKTIEQMAISFENLLVFLVFIKLIHSFTQLDKLKTFISRHIFLFITVIFLVAFYAIYMYNLGLASRMRVMFMPYLFIIVFFVFNAKTVK